jgi:Cft2 family RNA processing exonuclease
MGGASGIGASCVLVEVGELRAVVDCGIRQARGERLPELRTLQQRLGERGPDAIVLTHAHIDHSGALPVLHGAWPRAPIVTTPATAALIRILLLDALKIMDSGREEELPLYGLEQVESTLAAVRPLPFDDPLDLERGRIRLFPAGHILGAALAHLESGRRSAMISGDLSIADQRTVPGAPAPPVQPDVMVIESTYGDRLHASRAVEERRLCEQVAAAIARGGHVLIPAFAVGRAQEVLLSLAAAMRAGSVPRFPVYADGMVRAVCDAYRSFPEAVHPRLRRRIDKGDPFFGGGFEKVRGAAHRREIIAGPPCCVVASSGMLSGGASPVYARAWASEPASLIAITGYQDEESPGRALLDLADRRGGALALPGGSVELAASVERYHLSAHADADELSGLVRRVNPRRVCVVHGGRAARAALAERLEAVIPGEVIAPEDGELLALSGAPRPRAAAVGPGIARGRPMDAAALRAVADILLPTDGRRPSAYSAAEIARVWFGAADEAALTATRAALEGAAAFAPDPRLPYRYRPAPPPAPRTGPATLAEVQAALDEALPADSGVYKRSAHQQARRIVLSFRFPGVQGPAVSPALARISEETGWALEINPRAHQGAVTDAASALVPGSAGISLYPERQAAVVKAREAPADLDDRQRRFTERTGWRLELALSDSAPAPVVVPPAAAPPAPNAAAPAEAPAAGELPPQESRAAVDALFAGVGPPQAPLKARFPAGALVLHFVHPAIGERQRERLEALARRTGRAVRVHPHPNHQELIRLGAALIPSHWTRLGEPGYVPQSDRLKVVLWDHPGEEAAAGVEAAVRAQLGCGLEIVVE